jgi:ATP-dependent DNA helicase RecQ
MPAQKALPLTPEEFESITALIRKQLTHQEMTPRQLVEGIGHIKKEKAWKVIEFLQAEQKIECDGRGLLRLT